MAETVRLSEDDVLVRELGFNEVRRQQPVKPNREIESTEMIRAALAA